MYENAIQSDTKITWFSDQPLSTANSHVATPVQHAGRRKPVLLIDADRRSRKTLASSFTSLGMPLTSHASVESLSDAQTSFGLVAIGPGSYGDDSAVTSIRRFDSAACLPILMIGTIAVAEGMSQALTLGADDYLALPFSTEVLRARTQSLLAARLRSELAIAQAADRAMHLERALDSNRAIGIALGILMATQKVTAEEAFLRLRRVSQRSNRKLREIADDVIYTGALSECS